jgi:glycosyltransferase involved in cell wall biosynthesis
MEFTYSVIIPTHNEIRDLEVTVAMVWASEPQPHEIIVVDDCGDDGVKHRLRSFGGVKVVKTPERLGPGGAKRFGANMATGDIIVVMDSHMRVPHSWLETVDKTIDRFPESIFCCGCKNFTGDWVGCGATFSQPLTGNRHALFSTQTWKNRGNPLEIDRCPSLLGGCYFVPKHVWEALGGLNDCLYGWGYEEHDLSLRAYLTGFDVRRLNNLVLSHRFQRELKEPKKPFVGTHAEYNAMVVAACIFEDGVFERLFHPFYKQVAPVAALLAFEDNLDNINTFREFVQNRRVYFDEDLVSLCDFRLPSKKHQQQVTELIKEKEAENTSKRRRRNRKCMECSEEEKVKA